MYELSDKEKGLIRFVKRILLEWTKEHPDDTVPVSHSLLLLTKILGEDYI